MGDTLLRYMLLLREIPRGPRRVDAPTLVRRLDAQGVKVTVRTVQRDLGRLSRLMPLTCTDTTKPFGWCWSEAHEFQLPQLLVHPPGARSARTLRLVARFDKAAAKRVAWARVGTDRELEVEGATLRVAATLPDTPELRDWLCSFGDRVEVLSPDSLRGELHKRAQGMLRRHEGPTEGTLPPARQTG